MKKKVNVNMNTNSIPEFVDVGNGNIKIVLSNFTGELIARDIIGLTRYMDCPISTSSKKELNEPDGSKSPPFNDSDKPKNKVLGGGDKGERKNVSSQPVLEEGIDHPDQDDDATSVNLLEDSEAGSDEDTVDDKSTVSYGGLATRTAQHGLNVSVANDEDIEYEPELSQQVCYWKY